MLWAAAWRCGKTRAACFSARRHCRQPGEGPRSGPKGGSGLHRLVARLRSPGHHQNLRSGHLRRAALFSQREIERFHFENTRLPWCGGGLAGSQVKYSVHFTRAVPVGLAKDNKASTEQAPIKRTPPFGGVLFIAGQAGVIRRRKERRWCGKDPGGRPAPQCCGCLRREHRGGC